MMAGKLKLTLLWSHSENSTRQLIKERKVLNSKRLDLDACKSRLKKAKTMETTTAGNSRTTGGFTVEQAEADLRVAQAEFDKQAEITKLLLEGIQSAHNSQLKCLRDFVEAQMMFYAQAHQYMADLQRELSGPNSADSLYDDTGFSSQPPPQQ
ncbi:unnamed protein product, partial [Mesorhabditis spiculigera]